MSKLSSDAPRSDRPNLEQKKKLARELLKATQRLDARQAARFTWSHPRFRGKTAQEVIDSEVSLADAQQVIAHDSGFESWPRMVEYVRILEAEPNGPVAFFEDAVRSIIRGECKTLQKLLLDHPAVATMRSTRQHHSVLPHYLAANGVEDEHQITPPNAVEVARILFENGGAAVVDERADNEGGGYGSTPLVALVTSAHPHNAGVQGDLVREFVKAGAKVNGLEDDCLPLSLALGFRYIDAAKALVECGARVDNLPAAAGVGKLDLVNDFLDPEKKMVSHACMFSNPMNDGLPESVAPHPNQTVQQAFVFACMGGHRDIAERLLQTGIDINAGPRRGITALHETSYQGHLEIVDFLLANKANPVLLDEYWNSTAIGWANAGRKPKVIEAILSSGKLEIRDAIAVNRLDLVTKLLEESPAEANAPDGTGAALRHAAHQGNLELVRLLMEHGGDPTLQSESGLSASDYAEKAGHDNVVQYLKEVEKKEK